MMQTLEMNTEVPYGRVKTWDSSFVKSRRGAYLLTQITVLLMAIIFGIFTISRGYPAEFVLFLAVFFLALATAVLELIYRLFNLAENIGKSKMLMVKTFLDYYLPIGRCVSIAWALMICSSVGKTQGKFALTFGFVAAISFYAQTKLLHYFEGKPLLKSGQNINENEDSDISHGVPEDDDDDDFNFNDEDDLPPAAICKAQITLVNEAQDPLERSRSEWELSSNPSDDCNRREKAATFSPH